MRKFDTPPSVKCSDQALALCSYSVEILKKAGFVHFHTSMKSEACYYRLGDREGVLRVAGHRFGRTEGRMISAPVWSCLTWPQKPPKNREGVHSHIVSAVGRYIFYPTTKFPAEDHSLASLWANWIGHQTSNLEIPGSSPGGDANG